MSPGSNLRSSIHDLVRRAERLRRGRLVDRQLAVIAPFAAGALLVFVVLARVVLSLPVAVSWTIVGVALVAGAAYAWFGRRTPEISDAIATRLDADARSGGELRSAHWFAAQPSVDEWAEYHLSQATDRLGAIQWPTVYPPVKAAGRFAVAGVLIVAALAATVRFAPRAQATAVMTADGKFAPNAVLTPALRKQLEDLLASMKAEDMTAEEAARLAQLSDLLMKIDTSSDPKLAALLKKIQENAQKAQKANGEAAKGDETLPAASKPDDLRAELQDLADKLAEGRTGERQTDSQDKAGNSDEGQMAKASSQAQAQNASPAEMSIKLTREAVSDAGRGDMLQGGGSMGGDARSGRGGRGGDPSSVTPAALAEALRKELVEANADTPGANVMTEDIRRKTEQGKAGVGFTHVAPRTSFDPSRALPPPTVPPARRLVLEQYFIRR